MIYTKALEAINSLNVYDPDKNLSNFRVQVIGEDEIVHEFDIGNPSSEVGDNEYPDEFRPPSP